jgi:predicted ribosome-associated RNA-binding protein Tma20
MTAAIVADGGADVFGNGIQIFQERFNGGDMVAGRVDTALFKFAT